MIVTVLDVLYDPRWRPYSGFWRWDSRRPVRVELHLTPMSGETAVWVLARSLLVCPPLSLAEAEGDVEVASWHGRALITFYPRDPSQRLHLTGSLMVVRDFLAATELTVTRCLYPEACAGCAECDLVDAAVEAELIGEVA